MLTALISTTTLLLGFALGIIYLSYQLARSAHINPHLCLMQLLILAAKYRRINGIKETDNV